MATIGNSYINDLIHAGADAMPNMYDVTFATPSALTNTDQFLPQLKIRAKGFTPPTFNIGKHDVKYKSITLPMPSAVIEGDRTFEIEFRLDAEWDVYRMLQEWKALLHVGPTGYAGTSLDSTLFGVVTCTAMSIPIVGSSGTVPGETTDSISVDSYAVWTFEDVWISKLDEPTFTTGEGTDPITIKATFYFGQYSDPWSRENLL